MDLSRFVLENDNSKPISVYWSTKIRGFIYLFIIPIAIVAVLYSSLSTIWVNHNGRPAIEILRILWIPTSHLIYLVLIFWLLILSAPSNQLYKQRILFPLLLFAAYFSQGVEAFVIFHARYNVSNSISIEAEKFYSTIFHILSYIFFILLYFLWAFREWHELQRNEDPSRVYEVPFWITIETFAVFVLCSKLLGHFGFKKFDILPEFLDKNFIIVTCIFLWFFLQYFKSRIDKRGYHETYLQYLSRNLPGRPIFAKRDNYFDNINLIKDYLSKINNATIIDFGCGDGKRLIELLELLGIEPRTDLKIIGYDSNKKWECFFNEKLANYSNIFFSNKKKLEEYRRGIQFNIIFSSHTLYYRGAEQGLIKIIKTCSPGTPVIIRGASPNSFFYAVSTAYTLRLLFPTYSHTWIDNSLNNLINKCKLNRINGKLAAKRPDFIIQQYIETKDVPINVSTDLLGYLYGNTVKALTQEYFYALKSSEVEFIPNDDFVYAFTKSE